MREPSSNPFHREVACMLLAGALPALLIVAMLMVVAGGSFNKWDNLELFTPYLWFAHSRLLEGEFPHWCQSQFLGEPVHAVGQYGVLYPGYTLCVWLAKVSGLGPTRLMDVVVVLHAVISGCALYVWARQVSVGRTLAIIAAVSTVASGWMLYNTSVLMFIMPYLAATALGLCGMTWLVQERYRVRGFLVGVVSIGMAAHIGHGQFAFYTGLVVGLYALAYAMTIGRLKRSAISILAVFVVAALIAMPTVLPTLDLLASTGRGQNVEQRDYLAKSIPPAALMGMVLPVYPGEDSFSKEKLLYTVYGAAWILPAMLLGVALMRGGCGRLWVMIVLLALLWLSLAIGGYNPLYRRGYHVPGWSRFRWPYKWISYALPFMSLAGALALQRLSLLGFSRRRAAVIVVYATAAVAGWLILRQPTGAAAMIAGAAGLAGVLTLPWIARPQARLVLLVLVLVGSAALTHMVIHPGRYKTYPQEPYGKYSAQALHVDMAHRVLPASPANPRGSHMQPLGLHASALANGYLSATGTRWALTLSNVLSILPTNGDGSPQRHILRDLLGSHLLRSLNVGYVLVAARDIPVRRHLDAREDFQPIAENDVSLVYVDRRALPRAYFATHVLRDTTDAFVGALVRNDAPPRTALITGGEDIGPVPVGRVERLGWFDQRVEVDVTAPQGGLLVISMAHTPRWQAFADDRQVRLLLTNGAICGVSVPPGTSKVVLRYDAAPLRRGLWLALLGAVCAAGYMRLALMRRNVERPELQSEK